MAYTLQLMSTTEVTDAIETATHHTLTDYAICPYLHEGKTRYALLNGSYPSVAAAKQGIAGLPAPLRAASPWIRRIRSVAKAVH
jgi:septal ring-binding cell division protein DamX